MASGLGLSAAKESTRDATDTARRAGMGRVVGAAAPHTAIGELWRAKGWGAGGKGSETIPLRLRVSATPGQIGGRQSKLVPGRPSAGSWMDTDPSCGTG